MAKRLRRKDNLEDLFDQMQNFFDQFQEMGQEFTGLGNTIPVDIKEEDGKVVVTADLPGVQKEDISLKADSDSIEISAESSHEIKEENEKYFKKERSSRRFRRTVSWPTDVDPESIHASYQDGVLEISAEKTVEDSKDIDIE